MERSSRQSIIRRLLLISLALIGLALVLVVGFNAWASTQLASATAVSKTATAEAALALATPSADCAVRVDDDFVGLDHYDWPIMGYSDRRVVSKIAEGKYRWEIQPKTTVPLVAAPKQDESTDFVLSVRTRQFGNMQYGVAFHILGRDAFYRFLLDAGGRYSFQLYYRDEVQTLIDWTWNKAISPDKTNKITVTARGSHYFFFVNDRYVDQAENDRLTSGQAGIAFLASTSIYYEAVEFDDFELCGAARQVESKTPTAFVP